MAKVPLRVYNREIEGMIEGGQLDEAIAHCQHILKTFPMHVETYRLLGKSFLEARRYTDAADIFQRALMAVPDDFVSHVGMSIIRDDEGKLDDAIWHMERAFEGQPSNPAIQGELRRLYGRRDGIEPPKIRLSRDALANMYAQGELFNQAIAEIRAVLAEDTNRPDLQVMLARAYYRSGQKVEAAEMAANLLKKYTYCMDALRILVDVLPGTARAENTQIYRQRLRLLDPYSSFVAGSTFSTDQVVDTAVNLERLEYKAGSAKALPQPNWASSLGIKLADEKHAEPAPEWMKSGDSAAQLPAAAPDSSGSSAIPAADDKTVPDWMRTSGWQESGRKAQEGPVDFGVEKSVEPIARADIPDWLKAMAPKEVKDTTNAGSESAPANLPSPNEGDAPDWLKAIAPRETAEANAASEPAPVNPPSPEEEHGPDWMEETETAAAEVKPEPTQPATTSQENGAFPDWLKEMGENASAGTAAAFVADMIEQPQAKKPPASIQPATLPPAVQNPVEPPASTSQPGEESAFQPSGEAKPLKIEDDTMAWLESLAAKHGAKEEELLTKPEDRLEEMPDWLRPDDKQPASPTTPEPSPAPGETLPLEPLSPIAVESAAQEPASSTEPSPIPSETPPLEPLPPLDGELAAHEPTPVVELPIEPDNRIEEMPDWLHRADKQSVSTTAPEPSPTPSETVPLESIFPPAGELAAQELTPSEEPAAITPPAEGTAQPLKIEDDTMAWLESLVANKGKEEELPTKPENHLEEMPDWLHPTKEQPVSPAAVEPSPIPSETLPLEPLPPHAGELVAREPTPIEELPIEPKNRVEEMPDWLHPADEQSSAPVPEPSPATIKTKPFEAHIPLAGEVTAQEPAPSEEFAPLTPPTEETAHPLNIENKSIAWLEELAAKEGTKPEESPTIPPMGVESPPEWIQESNQVPAGSDEASDLNTPQKDITITSWLRKQDVEEALGKIQHASEGSQTSAAPSPELPDWLKELEQPTAPEEAPKSSAELPDWLRQPAQPADQGTAAIPTTEPAPEAEIPAWVDEEIPVPEQPESTSPEEWVPVVEEPSSKPEPEKIEKPVTTTSEIPIQRRVLGGTGMLARIPTQDKDAEFLAAAQAALDANKLNESMQVYTTLIKKNRLLDEVIHDLREAIYRFPVDITVWQTLGDASMRANRLQDALDAYTKAEELLR